jgi:hypothetical protein
VAIALITVYASNAHAEIYTCKDAKGETVYTDSPSACSNAEEIKADKLPTLVPSKSLTTRPSTGVKKAEVEKSYKELVITSPSNDATIRDNNGNLTINFRVAPALQSRKGHKFVVTVDGAEVYRGTSSITALKNVDRGTHTIAVKIVDPENSTKISATPVKFTLQRFSALNNADSNSTDANDTDNNNSEDNTTTNQKFPSNTKFNRPATPPPPPPPPSSGINN